MKMNWRAFRLYSSLHALLLLTACVAAQPQFTNSESLVLSDGSEVPCQILDIDDDYVYFEASLLQDRYKYGESLPIGEIKYIKVFRQDDIAYYHVDEFLDWIDRNAPLPTDEAYPIAADEEPEEPVSPAPAKPSTAGTRGNQTILSSKVIRNEFSKFEHQQTTAHTMLFPAPERSGPGLRSEAVINATEGNRKSGIGLRLPDYLAAPIKNALEDAEIKEIADLVVSSGAAGLVLYRLDKLASERIQPSAAQRKLGIAIREADEWQKRRQGLGAAHRVAKEDFDRNYGEVEEEIANELGFRARSGRDAFLDFILFLHTHGGLQSRRHRNLLESWFGELATRAVSDILANFNDWYYLFVIRAQGGPTGD